MHLQATLWPISMGGDCDRAFFAWHWFNVHIIKIVSTGNLRTAQHLDHTFLMHDCEIDCLFEEKVPICQRLCPCYCYGNCGFIKTACFASFDGAHLLFYGCIFITHTSSLSSAHGLQVHKQGGRRAAAEAAAAAAAAARPRQGRKHKAACGQHSAPGSHASGEAQAAAG